MRLVHRVGGRFYLYDRSGGRVLAEVDMAAPNLQLPGGMGHLSARSRVVSGEAVTDEYLRLAEEDYGPGTYQVILLWPETLEDRVRREIADGLHASGIDPREVVEVKGVYEPSGSRVDLVLKRAVLTGGKTKEVEIRVAI